MARLLSVNVGLPRDIEWQGRTVHTGIWKSPVAGRCRVRRLNVDGDGQGDLSGHGGEHRAVFVYQIESYRYWQERLRRSDFVYGQFGENFTVEGLSDDSVCIGDRYRIGGALFEVTQPRVTCYRIGIRMDEPSMPALLTSCGRPGFYFRVLQEGEVGAGDEIIRIGEAMERMSVADLNALLYSPNHDHDRLQRALRIDALAQGWRSSFEALLQGQPGGGNAGLMPAVAAHPSAPGFHRLRVIAIDRESVDVLSLTMQAAAAGEPITPAIPGQFVVVRLFTAAGGSPIFRSYSVSGPPSNERYRISVKIEPNGIAGQYLRERVRVGDVLDVSSPRGSFILDATERSLVLLSAGIGATPVLAMLYALESARSTRSVLWLHAARDAEHHPFAAEVTRLVHALPNARSYVCYSRPGSHDTMGLDFDAAGHFSKQVFDEVGVSPEAEVYLCGPNRFMVDMREILATCGVSAEQIHGEIFNGGESMTPGIAGASRRAPHLPPRQNDAGARVSFARSGIAVRWDASAYGSILELAEACDVPVRWSCRSGVCHNCESGLVSGSVAYAPEPLDKPANGNVLICCSQPAADVVLDL
ncbi:MAG TPA: MOSC and FAD-binding oxidoreductase domain-containing protein [Steroidobacteraceae bacterium]